MSQAELTQLRAAPAPTEPFDLITYIANRKIRGFCGTIDDQGAYLSNVYQENRSLAAHVTADYQGRFLIELIQNGNDIHPHDRADGEIEVLLDAGANPTLYVANRGGRFTDKNVNALCDIGMSSKPPGEAIGNKGLGFRSVHHITDAPEIYSQAEPISAKPSFDGFCFSFANEADLDRMLPDPMHRALAAQDLPLFHVPRWLSEQPESVLDFVCRGFSTVIRLPLRDSAALQAVKDELAKLQTETAPMLLFLGRLERLTARIVNSGIVGGDTNVVLQRKETRIKAARLDHSIVDLGGSGTFLLARRAIAESAMKKAIQSGVAAKQLHPSWTGWKGHGEVALAVRLDPGLVTPRLYTFLPMGKEAIAPFNGYLHGSFFPTSNRKALNTKIELNSLILVEATSLAAEVVAHLSCLRYSDFADSPNHLFDEPAAARGAVDLLVWRKVSSIDADENDKLTLSSAVAMKVAAALGKASFDDAPVIPCLGVWMGDLLVKPPAGVVVWKRALVARRCQSELSTFNVEVIAKYGDKVGIAPIWPGLGAARIKALSAFLAINMKRSQDQPTPMERAGIVASVASDIPRGKKPALARWTSFYRDLVSFMENDLASLAGHEILLCGDGSLRATIKQTKAEGEAKAPRLRRRKDAVVEASVFAPPARRGPTDPDTIVGGELSPPTALKEHFAFLEEALSWHDELASVRVVFEGKLFDPFDSDTVLTRLSQVLVRDGLKETRASGLRWAFLIWRRARESGRPIQLRAQHRFFAPTIDGNFIEARDAIFSTTWPEETQGKRLQQFLDLAPPECADLNAVRARRLASTSHRAFTKTKRTDLWTTFLTELGVQRGLKPIEKIAGGQIVACELTSFRFCKALGMSDAATANWAADVGATAHAGTDFNYSTEYVVNGSLWWMPGQGDYAHFSPECRELYALLIVDWIGHTNLSCWDIEIHHHFARNADTRQWPTPVASFIRTARWIPVDEPSSEGPVRNNVAPKDVWLASSHGSERFPPFLRRPTLKLLRTLERDQNAVKELVKRGQLRILNDPSTLIGQASFLAEQYKSGRVDNYHEREFVNLYHRTWRMIADRHGTTTTIHGTIVPPSNIIGRRDGLNVVIQIAESDAISVLHVRDNGEETIPGLIEATGGALFDARSPDPAKIGRVFKAFYGEKVRLVSDVRYELLVGKTPISEITCEQTVTQVCPWLRVMTAISLEALRDVELQRLPLDRSLVIARLERVGLSFASHITFRIDGKEIPSLDTGRRAFVLKAADSRPTVVVLHEGNLTWNTIESSLQAICEAIEQPSLIPHLRLLARELAAIGEHVDAEPAGNFELHRLCQTLFLDKQAVDAARDSLGAKLDRYLPWLRAIVHLAEGNNALAAFDALEETEIRDIGKLRAALSPLITGLCLDTDTILDACKHSFGVGELRENLKLDFAKFNLSLIAVGEAPDVDPERHRIQLAHFLADREITIIETLRSAFAPSLIAKIPAPEYARLRDSLRGLGPDPSWLLVHQHLPEALLETFLEKWLAKEGVPQPLIANTYKMPPIQSVRAANIPAVRKFAVAALPLVRTWCTQNSRTVPGLWQDSSSTDTKLRVVLDGAGAFDFLPLNEADILEWLIKIVGWPEGMPQTLDRMVLGITSTDVEVEQEKSREEQAAREAQARAIIFNGRNIDPLAVDWDAISEEVRVGLSRAALSITIGSQAKLSPVEKSDRKPEKRDAKNSRGGTFDRAPQEKRDMIGRLGEIAVYHWLKVRLPTQDIDKAWRSENAAFSTGRSGKDGLGYDFEIMFRKQTWLIEVKASLNDPQRFEMGETEVRAARVAARQRSGFHYVIAYVSNVGEPGGIHIELLPNPMTDEGANVLEILGEGIRYGFRRK